MVIKLSKKDWNTIWKKYESHCFFCSNSLLTTQKQFIEQYVNDLILEKFKKILDKRNEIEYGRYCEEFKRSYNK